MTLSQVFKSRLLSNIWNQFLLYGFSSIIPILLIPYLLNVIGVEKYGLVNFAIIFSFYFQIFNEFGFDLSNVRHVVNNRDNQEKLGRIVSHTLFSICLYFSCRVDSFTKEWTHALYISLYSFDRGCHCSLLAFPFNGGH